MNTSSLTDDTGEDRSPELRSRLPRNVGRLVVIALVGVVAAAIAGLVTLAGDPVYRSQTLLSIDQPAALAASTDGGLLDKLSRLRIKYTDLIATPEVATDAADELGLPVGKVIGSLSASAPPLSLTVVIAARAGDDEQAVAIANAAADSLVAYVADELEAADVPPAQRYEFTVLTPAVGAAKIEPTSDAAVRAAISFGLLTLGASYVAFELLGTVLNRQSATS